MPLTVAAIVHYLNARGTETVPDARQLLDRLTQVLVPRTALDVLDEWFPWARDQRLAMDRDVPDEDRMVAIRRLADSVRWSPNPWWGGRERRAWNELITRADREKRLLKAVKAEVLANAVVLVLGHRDEVRRIRVGARRGSFDLREDESGPTGVRPLDLPYSADSEVALGAPAAFIESPYRYWFLREVQKAATALMLDEPYPAPPREVQPSRKRRSEIPDNPAALLDRNPGSLLALLDHPSDTIEDPQLARALELATPVQRELVVLKAGGLSTAAAARARGMAPGTARVQMKLLRDKLRQQAT